MTMRERYKSFDNFELTDDLKQKMLHDADFRAMMAMVVGKQFDIGTLMALVDELIQARRPYRCLGWDQAVARAKQLLG